MSKTAFITYSGVFVEKNVLIRSVNIDKFLAAFENEIKQLIGPPHVVKLWNIVTGLPNCQFFQLPRLAAAELVNLGFTIKNNRAEPPNVNFDIIGELRPQQKTMVDHVMNIFEAGDKIGTAGAIVKLTAGTGKTFVAAGIIARCNTRALWITPKKPLVVQAMRDVASMLKCKDEDNGIIAANCQYNSKHPEWAANFGITYMTSSAALKLPPEYFRQFGLVVIDEVHTTGSTEMRNLYWKCQTKYMVGLSATVDERKDGGDMIYRWQIGKVVEMHQDKTAAFKLRAHVIKYRGPPEFTKRLTHASTGFTFTPYMNDQFIGDPYRMKLAAAELIRLYDAGHNIFVFSEEIEPLSKIYEQFKQLLTAAGRADVAARVSVAEFVGGLSESALNKIIAESQILLTTYGFGGTGISIVKMTAILFLTPRAANMTQIIARILRLGSDQSKIREVVDIVDWNTQKRKLYSDRRIAYEFYNATIMTRNICYTDLISSPETKSGDILL